MQHAKDSIDRDLMNLLRTKVNVVGEHGTCRDNKTSTLLHGIALHSTQADASQKLINVGMTRLVKTPRRQQTRFQASGFVTQKYLTPVL